MDYRTHVNELARTHQVRVIENPTPKQLFDVGAMTLALMTDAGGVFKPEWAFCAANARAVFVAPIADETMYAVALHEMGHVVGDAHNAKRGASLTTAEIVALCDEEDAAWAWAMRNAREWTPAMDAVREWARGTYIATLRRRVVAVYIPQRQTGKSVSQLFKK